MYYIVYCFLYLFSLLPFFVLYGISDFTAFLLRDVFKYRKEVIATNLLIAFPEKTEEERKIIAKKFYRNFTDTFIETIKLLSITDAEIDRRCTGNFDVINEVAKEGANLQVLGLHKFNWEFANLAVSKNVNIPSIGVYSPIETKAFDRLFIKIRSRYNTILIPTGSFKKRMREIMQYQHSMYLLADQNPGNLLNAYWLNFFGKMSPFINGPHKSSSRTDQTIVYIDFTKVKRGHYSFDVVNVVRNSAQYTPQELTKMYRNFVEDMIRKQPETFLWSHRRWRWDYNPVVYAANKIED